MEAAGATVAVTAATGALGPVIAKLGALLCNENMPDLEGRWSDIEFIKSKLEPVHSLLLRIWEREDLDAACKDWMAEARKLSYDMENAIDGFRFGPDQPGDGTNTSLFEGLKNQVQGLLNRCCEEWMTLGAAITSNPTLDDPRSRFLHKDASELVEVDQKKAQVIKLLQEHEMVCIYGIAGIGKTTLADLVYQAIGKHFQCRAFVSVSPRPNMTQILKTIVSEVIASAIAKAVATDERYPINVQDEQNLVDSIWKLLTDMYMHIYDTYVCSIPHMHPYRSDLRIQAIYIFRSNSNAVLRPETIRREVPDKSPPDYTRVVIPKQNHIDGISKLLVDKRQVTHSGWLAGTCVVIEQYLTNIISELLAGKREVTDSARLVRTGVAGKQYLINIISKFLADERYLIIVDDIWHREQWEVIENSLPKNNLGSRIIMTTRVNAIAEKCRTEDYAVVYEIAGLSPAAAAVLSERKFKELCKLYTIPCDMRSTCSSIAKMSGGMPLAVICMSSAVAEQLSPEEGQEIDPVRDRFHAAESRALEGFLTIPCLRPLIESFYLGYNELPLHLKTCLLHCSMYPLYHIWERDDLTRVWIAEGFVYEEEQARSYADELVNMGLIQRCFSAWVPALKYEMNTMMLHFLRCKSQEEYFVASLGYGSDISSLNARRIHRLSIHSYQNEVHISRLHASNTRFIYVFDSTWIASLKQFERLRLLHLHSVHLTNAHLVGICGLLGLRWLSFRVALINLLPTQIGRLRHLKTLSVSNTGILGLPAEIGELEHLETLDVSNTMVTELPMEIGRLQQLKTLDARNSCIRVLPKEIGELQHLETLDVSHTMVVELPREIGGLQHLKNLYARNTCVRELPKEIGKLQCLETLDVGSTRVAELPKEFGELQHLKTLDVSSTMVAELPKEIGKMQHLETLDVSKTQVRKLPWEAGQRSNSVRVLTGDNDPPNVVKLLENDLDCGDICSEKDLSIMLFDGFGSSWEPIPVARFKIAGTHTSVPEWLENISSLDIRFLKLGDEGLKKLGKMPNLQALALRFEVTEKRYIAITGEGFARLECFCVDCRVPRVTFQKEAMPKLKHLEFKFYACRATEYSMGITQLKSLQRVVFRSTSWYKSDAPGISAIINRVREEAKQHRNWITLCINDKDPEVFSKIKAFTCEENGVGIPGNDVLIRRETLLMAATRRAAADNGTMRHKKPKGNYPVRRE